MLNKLSNDIRFYNNALDGTWARDKAISSNIANVNTPEYKRKYVKFEDQLKSKIDDNDRLNLSLTNEKHIGVGNKKFTPLTLIDKSDMYRIDGNNVNIDTESAELAKNTIMYDAIARQLTGEFEKIRNVLTEGSK